MYTISTQIRRAYIYMRQGNFANFATTLYTTLYFMALQRMISHQTVLNIVKVLHLKDKGVHMETNPDGTISIYENDWIVDTFFLDDVFMWLLKQLMEDEIMKFNDSVSSVAELDKIMQEIFLPDSWTELCRIIDENMTHPLCINEHIYYLQKTIFGSYVMKKVKYKKGKLPKMDEAETIVIGTEPEIIYVPERHGLYSKIKGMDAYVHYNDKSGKRQMVYHAELVGVCLDGTEWYRDREGVLCSFADGILRRHKDVLPTDRLYLCKDGIKVASTVFDENTSVPYILNAIGERQECSHRDVCQWLWRQILHSLTLESIVEKNKENFTHTIQQERVYKIPFPFTKENVLNKIECLSKTNNDEKEKVVKLLEGYKEESAVNVFYKYWKTQKLLACKKRKLLSGKIGSFTEEEGKLLTDFDSVLNGQIQENKICRCNAQRYEGEVYYNLKTQTYMLVWNREGEFKWQEELEAIVGATVILLEGSETQEDEEDAKEDERDVCFEPEEIEELLKMMETDDFPF